MIVKLWPPERKLPEIVIFVGVSLYANFFGTLVMRSPSLEISVMTTEELIFISMKSIVYPARAILSLVRFSDVDVL